jgi:hypothetical protein
MVFVFVVDQFGWSVSSDSIGLIAQFGFSLRDILTQYDLFLWKRGLLWAGIFYLWSVSVDISEVGWLCSFSPKIPRCIIDGSVSRDTSRYGLVDQHWLAYVISIIFQLLGLVSTWQLTSTPDCTVATIINHHHEFASNLSFCVLFKL